MLLRPIQALSLSHECIGVPDEAIAKYGKPAILSSDQVSQFTCPRWVNKLKAENIQISMDGKERAKDNIRMERFWSTDKRAHQDIGGIRPCEAYKLEAA